MSTYIIVGAGILGASTAYHLAKAGATVTLIDRGDKGQATDAAAGIVCPWLTQRRNKAWYQLAKNGARYYPELINQLKGLGETETGYAKVGAISLHTDESKLIKMEERARARLEDAPEIGKITRLSPIEAKELLPVLADGYGAVHVSGAARVNGRALREALINAAKKYGATYLEGEAHLVHEDHQVRGVKLEAETMYANQIIVTTGAWAKELFQPLGVTFKIEPQKAQIVHLELPNTNTLTWPVVMPPNNQYLLSLEDGRIVIGATHEDEKGYDKRPTLGGMYEVFDKALSIAPGLADCTVLETRVGFRPVAPNFLPIIGPLPNWNGILLANGLGASGLTVGPYLGGELAKIALKLPTEIDIELYAVAGAVE
ncbi:FAD-dependent oxidoreductase [Alkalihalophilus lindianensis]|uniref:FAD-dependent oxidoreductase n=1 Tax=Alkalihalophilus lindianensis TaxID=1630542 RepID=A0ABU3XG26_9BACI|nr:FAD-dependent oxidoreductase [Alkalihalophilus lindianensis]MDV2686567.1 FAD-dependent oxidoreductase [Alkalihalophilus lindianensis]